MNSIVQLEQQIRNRAIGFCIELFDYLNVNPSKEDIVFDYCKYDGEYIEAEFYIRTVEKYKRDIFYEIVDFIQPKGEVKLEKKREKHQRIYIKFQSS